MYKDYQQKRVNAYKPSVLFVGHRQNSADPDQMPQNVVSDQGLHSLLTERSIKIWKNMKNNTQQPLKQKCTGPIDDSGKSHSA